MPIVDPLKAPSKATKRVVEKLVHKRWHEEQFPDDPVRQDFRVFLSLLFKYLGFGKPTDLQLSIAYYLQYHGWTAEIDRFIIMAFRGAAKSLITSAYALWRVHRNPQLKIGVVSGSGKRAVMFVQFALKLIDEWEVLHYLQPKPNQKQSSTGFDVAPCTPDQTPSIWAAGITSQIVGFRADIIVFDDVETNTNSMTQDAREKLREAMKEFESIIKPGGQLAGLGTPQTSASVYKVLYEKSGYAVQIWPARYPTGAQERLYGPMLAKWVRWKLDKQPSLRGTPTEPTRFSDEDLKGREASIGRSTFNLQFMLDTTLSDADKYPLRLADVPCMMLDRRRAPDWVTHGTGEHLLHRDLSPIALDGDRIYRPAAVATTTSLYQTIMGFIDPSGRGADEATLTIGGVLHSTPFILKQAGWRDGYSEATLKSMAALLVAFKVRVCRVEDNFGQGMFVELLRPYVAKEWEDQKKRQIVGPQETGGQQEVFATELLSERAKKVQKELRILESLEPVFHSHRLVISKEVYEDDWEHTNRIGGDESEYAQSYSLMYQTTNLTREPKSLPHDDRVDGLGGLVGMMLEMLGQDPRKQAEAEEERRMDELFARLGIEEDDLRGDGQGSGVKLRGNLRAGHERIGKIR
jgi:hypothetical protein